MYGGDNMEPKPPMDPYAEPSAPMPPPGDTHMHGEANGTNGKHVDDRDRGRSKSRSRSRSPGKYRSPGRDRSPPSYRRRSPPPPRRPAHAPMPSGPGRPTQAPNPSKVLGVFGLSIRTQERQLEDEFSRYGRPEKVTIVYDARTGRSRGFGFIAMSTVEEATACIEKLNGVELDGRRIRVDYSVTDRPHAPTPGEYMGTRRDSEKYRGGGRYERDRGADRDRGYDRDRRDRDRDRDRDAYGGGSYRDWRDKDRDRDRGDWRSRRSPPARGSRYSASPPPRRRRSYSRSPRGTTPVKADDRLDERRW